MSTSAASASAAGAGTIASFIEEFIPYNNIHTDLRDPLSQFNTSYQTLVSEMIAVHQLRDGTIKESVTKKNAWEQLKPKLQGLTKEYTKIRDDIRENNGNLEQLKARIEAAIAAKKLAAAAAKAAQDASAAAQAQALAEASQAVQTQIVALNGLIATRKSVFEEELRLKHEYVVHMVDTVIPNKVEGIQNLLLPGEPISQTTKDMVKGIETDITVFKSGVKFKSITEPFKVKNDAEIVAIQGQIVALTVEMNGGNIPGMKTALASTPLRLSTTLGDFISAADKFIGTLDAKLAELYGAEKRVKAAIEKDLNTFQEEEAKIKGLWSKIDEVVDSPEITEIKHSIDDKITDVESKYGIVDKLPANATPLNKQIKITQYATSITGLNTELMELDNAIHRLLSLPNESFDTIQQQLIDIQSARTSRGIDAPSSLSILNQKIQGFQDKRKEVNGKYKEHHDNHERISEELLQSRSPSPIVPVPPSDSRPPSAAPRAPRTAWAEEQTKEQTMPTYGPILAGAASESEKIAPPAPIIGARRNFLHISHNTNPPTAYLVVVKKPRLDESNGGSGGNKNYHVQKGGAGDPPPVRLPKGSEIFPIDIDVDVDNPTFLGVMAGLIPPSVLLKVDDDGSGEHPIIQKIRKGKPLSRDHIALYDEIKRELITQENENPLTIGLRAVYYRNIIELIRYLDKILSTRPHIRRERPASASALASTSASASPPQPSSHLSIRPASASSSSPSPSREISPHSIRPGAASAAASVEPPLTCEDMYTRLRNFLNYTHGTYGVVAALFKKTFRREIDSVIPSSIVDKKEEIKRIVGWNKNKTSNRNFNKLIDIFSKDCPPENEFLTRKNPTNLGSNPYAYNQFRLNWIILLAFHTLYIGKTKPERVGELIKALYDAFLGWMTMTGHKDTTMRIFSQDKTLVNEPDATYSDEVENQMKIAVGDPTLQLLVKDIQDKLCELENDKNPVIEVLHGDEYDDEQNDQDYSPRSDESDYGDDDKSAYQEQALADLRKLSPSGLQPGARRRPQLSQFRQGPQTPRTVSPPLDNPLNKAGSSSDDTDSEFEGNDKPPVSVLSEGDIDSRRQAQLLVQLQKMGVQGLGNIQRPSSPQANPDSQRTRQTLRHSLVGRFHTDATTVTKSGQVPPMTEEALLARRQQQQTSQPSFIRTQSVPRPINAGPSVARQPPHPTPAPTPAPASASAPVPAWKANPPSVRPPGYRPTPSTKRIPKGGNQVGRNKKRTRKHKKHTSISAFRRPTRRRRRIPPTEGHKYTRKHPRT
jgi:hypothetical protein